MEQHPRVRIQTVFCATSYSHRIDIKNGFSIFSEHFRIFCFADVNRVLESCTHTNFELSSSKTSTHQKIPSTDFQSRSYVLIFLVCRPLIFKQYSGGSVLLFKFSISPHYYTNKIFKLSFYMINLQYNAKRILHQTACIYKH